MHSWHPPVHTEDDPCGDKDREIIIEITTVITENPQEKEIIL